MPRDSLIPDPAALLEDRSPDLDGPSKSALAAVLASPTYFHPIQAMGDPRVRKPLIKALTRSGISHKVITQWIGGLAGLGHSEETLSRLITTGWLDPWEIGASGPLVCLSVLASDRLGVVLHELSDGSDISQWGLPFINPRKGIKARQHYSATDQGLLYQVADTAVGPAQDAIDAEEAALRGNKPLEVVLDPWSGSPLVLLGTTVYRDRRKKAQGKKAKSKKKKAA